MIHSRPTRTPCIITAGTKQVPGKTACNIHILSAHHISLELTETKWQTICSVLAGKSCFWLPNQIKSDMVKQLPSAMVSFMLEWGWNHTILSVSGCTDSLSLNRPGESKSCYVLVNVCLTLCCPSPALFKDGERTLLVKFHTSKITKLRYLYFFFFSVIRFLGAGRGRRGW